MNANRLPSSRPARRLTLLRQRGVTLVELMIALTLGLLIAAAMSMLFVSSSSSRREVELSAEVIENGRYAIDVLKRELSMAGFYGTLTTPSGTTIDLCTQNKADWSSSFAIHATGLNNAEADPACLTRKSGTDALLVQRASTCQIGDSGCEAENANFAYLQVSDCGTEHSTTPFVLDAGNAATFTLKTKACTDVPKAGKRKLIRRIFFVNTSDVLSYMDIPLTGTPTPVPLVENIEQLQIEYALDGNLDGVIDSYNSTLTAAQWPNVIGARVSVLARSTGTSKNMENASLTFTLGDTIVTRNDGIKRRVYSTYIPFETPRSRSGS